MTATRFRGRRWAAAALLSFASACTGMTGMATLTPREQDDVSAHATVSAVDAGEIQHAQLADGRAASAAVRAFAEQMIADHSAALEMRERRLGRVGLGLRFSTPIATGSAGYAPPSEPRNAQGIVLNSMVQGGLGTTGTNMGEVSSGEFRDGAVTANAQGVGPNSMVQGGMGTTGTNMGEVNGIETGAPQRTDVPGAFTAEDVVTPAGMDELNALLLRNPYSRPVTEATLASLATLRQLSGAAFDRVYMDRQVAAHRDGLSHLDRLLAQNGLTGGMRALLTTQRASMAAHLQTAQQIRAGL